MSAVALLLFCFGSRRMQKHPLSLHSLRMDWTHRIMAILSVDHPLQRCIISEPLTFLWTTFGTVMSPTPTEPWCEFNSFLILLVSPAVLKTSHSQLALGSNELLRGSIAIIPPSVRTCVFHNVVIACVYLFGQDRPSSGFILVCISGDEDRKEKLEDRACLSHSVLQPNQAAHLDSSPIDQEISNT